MSQATTALREQMVAKLRDRGAITTGAVAQAMSHVPRHLFLPEVDASIAYLDEAVLVKHGHDGSPLSSASQPTIVATMLERLDVLPGARVLEVGTGTGYNAALLAVLVGDSGFVVTVELERDLADQARQRLAGLGLQHVEVVVGDGRDGYPPGGPYDRMIVTAGAATVAGPWTQQLVSGGRLVVPLVDRRGVGTVVVFDKIDGQMMRGVEVPCAFLPIRDDESGEGNTGT